MLVIDIREKDHSLIEARLRENCVPCELRQLTVGDFLCIAKRKTEIENNNLDEELLTQQTSESNSIAGKKRKKKKNENKGDKLVNEIVLDCVAERKTSNDLASSIKDGRYKDQKYRILQSHLRNKVYIIEGISMVDNPKCTAVRTAVADTSVAHDMRILRTRNIDHTIQLLCSIYNQTVVRFQSGKCFYKKKILPVSNFPFLNQTQISSVCDNGLYISYDDFKQLTVKKTAVTVTNLFGEILHNIYNIIFKNILLHISQYKIY